MSGGRPTTMGPLPPVPGLLPPVPGLAPPVPGLLPPVPGLLPPVPGLLPPAPGTLVPPVPLPSLGAAPTPSGAGCEVGAQANVARVMLAKERVRSETRGRRAREAAAWRIWVTRDSFVSGASAWTPLRSASKHDDSRRQE